MRTNNVLTEGSLAKTLAKIAEKMGSKPDFKKLKISAEWGAKEWGEKASAAAKKAMRMTKDSDAKKTLRKLAGMVEGRGVFEEGTRESLRVLAEEEMDPNEYNKALSKLLKRLKRDAGAESIRQNYKGTGKKKYKRQLWVQFKSGAVIDLWLEKDRLGLGGVVKRRADPSKAPHPLPKAIKYEGKSPEEVYKEAARLLKRWAG